MCKALTAKLSCQVKGLFYLPFHGVGGQLLTGKNLLLSEQILSFKNRQPFGKASSTREADRKSQKLFPLKKNGIKTWRYNNTAQDEHW